VIVNDTTLHNDVQITVRNPAALLSAIGELKTRSEMPG
jgi:hypothetical protein